MKIFLLLFILILIKNASSFYEQTTDAVSISLETLKYDTQVRYAAFLIPENTLRTKIYGVRLAKDSRCTSQIIYGGIQAHGYPYINPLNSTISSSMRVLNENIYRFSLDTDSTQVSLLLLERPISGLWYVAVFVNPNYEIKPCSFKLHVTFVNSYILNSLSVGINPLNDSTSNSDTSITLNLKSNVSQYVSFKPQWRTISVLIQVLHCRFANMSNWFTDVQSCPLNMSASSDTMPSTNGGSCCEMKLDRLNGYNHPAMIHLLSNTDIVIQLAVKELEGCITPANSTSNALSSSFPCFPTRLWDQELYPLLNTKFSYFSTVYGQRTDILAPLNAIIAIPFYLRQNADTFGSLQVSLGILIIQYIDQFRQIDISACIQRGGLTNTHGFNSSLCDYQLFLSHNSTNRTSTTISIPYPKYGYWTLQFSVTCTATNQSYCNATEDKLQVPITVGISTTDCDSLTRCGDSGSCSLYVSHSITVSACKCPLGYGGMGCTPMNTLPSIYAPIRDLTLLTISNVGFAFAFIVACKRRLFIAATLYLYVLIFSTFYHCCDTGYAVSWCVIPTDYLSFCDFYGAIMAIWVTLMSMAWIPGFVYVLLTILMALLLVIGIMVNRYSMITFGIPLGLGLAILLISWIYICISRKRVFPSWRYYILHLIPGIIISIVAGTIFYLGSILVGQYALFHSLWHLIIAIAVCVLLPFPHQWHRMFSWPNRFTYHVDVTGVWHPASIPSPDPSRQELINHADCATNSSSPPESTTNDAECVPISPIHEDDLTLKETLKSILSDIKIIFTNFICKKCCQKSEGYVIVATP